MVRLWAQALLHTPNFGAHPYIYKKTYTHVCSYLCTHSLFVCFCPFVYGIYVQPHTYSIIDIHILVYFYGRLQAQRKRTCASGGQKCAGSRQDEAASAPSKKSSNIQGPLKGEGHVVPCAARIYIRTLI